MIGLIIQVIWDLKAFRKIHSEIKLNKKNDSEYMREKNHSFIGPNTLPQIRKVINVFIPVVYGCSKGGEGVEHVMFAAGILPPPRLLLNDV